MRRKRSYESCRAGFALHCNRKEKMQTKHDKLGSVVLQTYMHPRLGLDEERNNSKHSNIVEYAVHKHTNALEEKRIVGNRFFFV